MPENLINNYVLKIDPIEYLKEISEKNSKKLFLIDVISDKKLTYGNLHIGACSIASKLLSLGLKKGEKISIICKNSEFLVRFYFACLYAGIIVIPINPILTSKEIEFIIDNSNSKMILYDDDIVTKINLESFSKKQIFLYNLDHKKMNYSSNEQILDFDSLETHFSFSPFHNISSDDDMAIVYTSGTTSEPKGVIHTISDFVNNAYEFGKLLNLKSENRFYNMLPLTYLGGYFNLLLIPYVHGCSVVLDKSFDSKSILNFWSPIIKNQVNTLWLIPSIISILQEFDRGQDGVNYCLNNIKLTLCGTAPLPIPIRKNFEKRYGVNIIENYGMSETFFISTNIPAKILDDSVGQILPSVKIRITNDDQILPNEKEGEIEVNSPYSIKKYFQNNDLQKLSDSNGWFKTGDLGYISENNEIFITGRKKDLIIRSGINISPLSIENILYKHPEIRECAIVGIPHKFQGEEIICVVSLKSEKNFESIKKQLFELCDKELSTIKKPSKIVCLSELPHTSSGKIQKRKIKAWLEQNSSIHATIPSLDSSQKHVQLSKIAKNSIQALSIKYNNLVYEQQRNGQDIIVLSLGEAFFDIPLYPFDDLPISKIFHYSHSRGIPELRQNIAKYFAKSYDVTFDSESEILITAGSKIAIHMALMTLIDPGDEIIIYEPAWVSYPEQIKLCHGIPVSIPFEKNIYDFEDYVTDKTKAIIVNNPNNPSGRVFNLEEMSYIHNLAKKYGFFVISDEAYSDFVRNQDEFISFGNLDIEKTNTVIINSISKNFGISGWRLGYLISNRNFIDQVLKINQHLITCPSTILQYYIDRHFNQIIDLTKPQILDLLEKREKIKNFMSNLELKFLFGTSTFYFFLSIKDSSLSSMDFCDALLNDYHVSAAPGIGYGKSCDSFIRIGIGSEDFDRIKTGILKIKDLISKTKNNQY